MLQSGKAVKPFSIRAMIFVLAVCIAGCGTILHPGRQGQRAHSRLDVSIVILDGIGLFFFIIPGVIAYAVDFSNHTIYLPAGRHRSSLDNGHKYVSIHIDGKMDEAAIEKAIRVATGKTVDMQQQDVKVVQMKSLADLDSRFSGYASDNRVALAR